MKTLVSTLVCLTIVAGMVLAGGAKEGAGAAARRITANVASTFPTDSPQDRGLHRFRELVTQRSGGRIEILIHPANAMGDERQTFEMLSQGAVEYGVVGTGDISTFFPRFFISEVPYVFGSQDDFWKFWNGPGRELSAMIERERGVRTDGVVLRGARYLTSNRAVRNVADVRGLKLRLPPVRAWFRVWESLGALPTQIAFGEVYMALKTGVVEAQENPPETILNFKFFEAQRFLMNTEHVYSAARVQSSVKWWNTLSREDQALLSKAMEEGVAFANSITRDGDAQFVRRLQELGMELVPVDKGEFRRAVQPVIDQLAREEWDPAFFERVRAALR